MSNLKDLKNKASNLNALVVEDSLTIQKQIKIFLEKLFNQVFIANNGLEALELIENEKIDVVLSDLQMPKMDGHEFINKLKEKNIQVQIIIFSAYGHPENVIKFLRLGVSEFLQKPVNFQELTKSLEVVVNNLENENIDNKHYKNEIIEDFELLRKSKSRVELLNSYKGLPLIHKGTITKVSDNYISLTSQGIQLKAILITKDVVIKSDKYLVKANLKSYDEKNKEVVLGDIEKYEDKFEKRESLRVEPDDSFKVVIYSSNNRLSLSCKKVSVKNLEFVVEDFEDKLDENDDLSLIISFDINHTSSYHNNISHKERIDCKGLISKVEKLESNKTMFILDLKLDNNELHTLEKYIYQREVYLINEFKTLRIVNK